MLFDRKLFYLCFIYAFQFKKINHANSILSDEKKREIYDAYGSFGLYIADQFGDEVVHHVMLFSSKWFQVRIQVLSRNIAFRIEIWQPYVSPMLRCWRFFDLIRYF